MKKNKELQEAESIINHQKEKINMLNIQQKDEIDALQKKLQSNKCALDGMKKTLDNEKAFRICADEEKKNLKEQIKCNEIKYKSLENENEKLICEKLKIDEAKSKISEQCNKLIQKNISLENYCEKKELAFDEQTNVINQLENDISELKEKINNYVEIEKENNKLGKQIKLISKQMEAYENEREVYVQRLQKIQKEENELKCTINDFKKQIDVKNKYIDHLTENISDINSKNSILSENVNNLQINFTNCLQFLDEIFDKYVKCQVKQYEHNENNEASLTLEPILNEAFGLFEKTLVEYQLLKSSYKESEISLKDEINKKENIIKSLKDNVNNYKQLIVENANTNILETKKCTENLNLNKIQNDTIINNHLISSEKIEKNLMFINNVKLEILPKQKFLISECKKFLLEKIKEIENLNISKNNYVEKVHIKMNDLNKKIIDKNIIIKELKTEVLKLEEKIIEKNTLCNEMEIELHHLKENFGIY